MRNESIRTNVQALMNLTSEADFVLSRELFPAEDLKTMHVTLRPPITANWHVT